MEFKDELYIFMFFYGELDFYYVGLNVCFIFFVIFGKEDGMEIYGECWNLRNSWIIGFFMNKGYV